jgi:hypothetical protein
MGDLLLLAFAIALVFGGFAIMIYALVSIARDNYKPRHTRSTYIPKHRK